jgi:predicted nucleotidyltransferase
VDFARVDDGRLAVVDAVISEVLRASGVDPRSVLLIGAEARDILHSARGHVTSLRGTTDVDIGIAVEEWAVYARIEAAFDRTGDTGIRFLIAGLPVDVVPFGAVEDPRGVTRPQARGTEDIVVFGFADALRHAWHLPLPSGAVIRLPRVEAYVAMKMRAWIERSPDHEHRDAYDLAVALGWHLADPSMEARAWEHEALVTEADGDLELVIATLLGADAASALSEQDRHDLRVRWSRIDLDTLARPFSAETGQASSRDPARARRLLDALTRGLHLPTATGADPSPRSP